MNEAEIFCDEAKPEVKSIDFDETQSEVWASMRYKIKISPDEYLISEFGETVLIPLKNDSAST